MPMTFGEWLLGFFAPFLNLTIIKVDLATDLHHISTLELYEYYASGMSPLSASSMIVHLKANEDLPPVTTFSNQ